MKKYLTILALFTVAASFGQGIERGVDEDLQSFIKRLMPEDMVLAHHIIETNRWSYPEKMIVACYGYNDSMDIHRGTRKFARIEGHVYLPVGNSHYRDITFGPIVENEGYPEIKSIFFTNADRDTTKEMVVLCTYDTKTYDFEGTIYRSFFFNNPKPAVDTLRYMEEMSRRFYGMEGIWHDGKANRALYKSAKEIRAKLKELGY